MTEEPVRDRSNTPPHNPRQANLAGPAGPVCSFRTQQRAPHTTVTTPEETPKMTAGVRMAPTPRRHSFLPTPEGVGVLETILLDPKAVVDVPPLSTTPETLARVVAPDPTPTQAQDTG